MREVSCDLCGGRESTVRFPLEHSRIVSCDECGFSFVNPRVHSEVILKKVQEWSREDVVDPERLRVAFGEGALRRYSRYLSRIERLRRVPGNRLLDVGCSTGAFLTVARSRGWEADGLEVGETSAEYASSRLGLRVHRASLFDYDPPPGSYDVIVMLEVIEHLESPAEALERVSRWLEPGGMLLLSTPNFDSLFRRLHGAGWWVVNCEEEHIIFFTPSTLRRGLERKGLEVLFARTRGFDLMGMLRAFSSRGAGTQGGSVTHTGYYESRHVKERLKGRLRRTGVLDLARSGMEFTEALLSSRWSPLRGLGEQLVFIAAKRREAQV